MTDVKLRLVESTALAHAMLAAIAADAGIRLLSIKGPSADHHRLREPRVASDADVWVEPARFGELCSLIEARGWHLRVGRETPSLLPQHSRTFIHESWPCDLDIHWMFPGFFADPDTAFETVWERREPMNVAHVEVMIPSLAGAAVIGMLHSLRNAQLVRHNAEGARIHEIVTREMTASDRAEFHEIARAGGALWVLRDVISAAGFGEVVSDLTDDEKRRWNLYQSYVEDGSAVSWWMHLKATPWHNKAGILVRAVWVARADMPRNDPTVLPDRAEVFRYQKDRWVRGARAMRRYFRTSRRR